jgi:predicted metalloprotease
VRRLAPLLLLLCCLAVLPGCGSGDIDKAIQHARDKAREIRARAQQEGAKLARQVGEALDRVRQAVPRAQDRSQAPSAAGQRRASTIDGFLTEVLRSVDGYWTKTLRAAGRPAPSVRYFWVPPGRTVGTACGAPAGADAAFYCPNDDTIYVSQSLAAEIYRGVASNFPGEQAGQGHAVGDFGLAYVVAHEYAHNIQQELGIADVNPRYGVEPLELQADCMAGLWGNSVYKEGLLQPGDVQEAISTAQAAGDFEYGNPQHHGTPAQRRAAWLLGYRSGDPSRCANPGV